MIDLDEYIALDPSATWSATTVLRELRSLPANVTSAYIRYDFLDPYKYGHVTPRALEAALPGLAAHEAAAIVELKQTADRWYTPDCVGCYWQKLSIITHNLS